MERFELIDYVDSPNELCTCLYSSISTPMHTHTDFYEITLITGGGFYNGYKGNSTLHEKNSLLFFCPGEAHSITVAAPNSTHLSFLASAELVNHLLDTSLSEYKKFLEFPYRSLQLSYLQCDYLISLGSLLTNMRFSEHRQTFYLFLHNIFFLLAMEPVFEISDPVSDLDYIDTLILRMNNYYYINTDISSIYLDYPIAQCTLTNLFKKRTGHTIVNYRNIKRMEYAAKLLVSWNYSVTDVANILNITCLSYFSKLFKQQFGMTPKKYQKLHQKPYQGTRND